LPAAAANVSAVFDSFGMASAIMTGMLIGPLSPRSV
jgi:homoserine kinase